MKINKKCLICEEQYLGNKKQKYCTSKCNSKAYYLRNKETVLSRHKEWLNNNRDKVRETSRKWYSKNKEHMRVYRKSRAEINRKYWKERRAKDAVFRIKNNLRNRLNAVLNAKNSSATKLVGCSWKEFRAHLESKFTEGMSWDNYGKNGWHLDHVKPLDAFDLTKEGEIKKACHYTNLQPLWAIDNLKKGNSYDK